MQFAGLFWPSRLARLQEASQLTAVLWPMWPTGSGEDSTLLRQNLLLQTRGGLLSVSDRDAPVIHAPEKLSRRRAAGVRAAGLHRRAAGFRAAAPPGPAGLCAEHAGRGAWPHAAPFYTCRSPTPHASRRGSPDLHRHLRRELSRAAAGGRCQDRAGQARLASGRPAAADGLHPPGSKRRGRALCTGQELQDLLDRESPAVFFSQDLCARYFTYARDGETPLRPL